jgi:hydroxypyruvate reductase
MQALTARLLGSGASIHEINTLRRHLDVLKGGGFLRHTQASVLSLILSDVPGNALSDIASGPTAADQTTRGEALAIARKYNLSAACSADILSTIEISTETLKPQDPRLANVQNVIIGSNMLALQAALKQADREGLHPYLLRADLAGEAREVARELCQSLRWACQRGEPVARPFCMVAGGETTVTLRGDGSGGRNTELALAAVTELTGFPDVLLVTLATDGEDGSTDAAGAIVGGASWHRAESLGLQHPLEYLRRNDSYTFFAGLDDLIKTGPTGTNVNDLVLMFGF